MFAALLFNEFTGEVVEIHAPSLGGRGGDADAHVSSSSSGDEALRAAQRASFAPLPDAACASAFGVSLARRDMDEAGRRRSQR